MDIALFTAFLSPFIPYLLKLGGQATGNITDVLSEKFGEAAWEKAQKVWNRLHPSVEEREELKVATTQVAAKPDSKARQAVLQEELELLLKDDPVLAEVITKIMEEDAPDGTSGTQIVQNVVGEKNQAIGQVFGGKVVGNVEGDVTM